MSKYKKLFDLLFPGALSLLVFFLIVIWLHLDNRLPHWDMGRHLYQTVVYEHLWQRVWHNPIHLASVLTNYYYYPPLVHNVGLLFEAILGFNPAVAVASNLLWLLILGYSVYFSAKQLFGRLEGVVSLLFVLASPMIIGQLHEFQLDLPLTAMVALSIYLILESEAFTNRRFSILLGVVTGLGMMTKWTYLIFFLPALLLMFIAFDRPRVDRRQIWQNLFLALFFCLIICGAWYGRNLLQLKQDFMQNGVQQAVIEGDPHGFTKDAMLWYLQRLCGNYLFLPLSLYALLGTISVVFNRVNRRKGLILISLALIYYFVISALANKDVRYIMPETVVLALLSGAMLKLSSSKIYKVSSIMLIVAIFVANQLVVPFSEYISLSQKSYALADDYTYGVIYAPNGYTSSSPKPEMCPMDQIIAAVPSGISARQIGISQIDFSDWAVAYYLKKSGHTWSGQTDSLEGAQYLIHRSSDPLPAVIALSPIYQSAQTLTNFACLDNTRVEVLKTNQ